MAFTVVSRLGQQKHCLAYTQHVIPAFMRDGNLPPGQHLTNWPELAERFGGNGRRDRLVEGLSRMLLDLARAGCKAVFLDGSFVSREKWPNDFDLCFDPQGMNSVLLPPELLDVGGRRAKQKAHYSGEGLSSATLFDWQGRLLVEMFGLDKERDTPKGLLVLHLEKDEARAIQEWRRQGDLPDHPYQALEKETNEGGKS